MKKLYITCVAVIAIFQVVVAQQNTFPPSGNAGIGTLSPGNNVSFQNVNETAYPIGLTWFNPTPLNYGIYRTEGSWAGPNYQQLKLQWDTGILLEPGNAYGKSYVEIAGNGLRISTGNIGVGTLNPFAKLQVGNGTSNTGSTIAMLSAAVSGGAVSALSLVNCAAPATGNEVDLNFHTAGNYSPTATIGAIAQATQPATDLAFSTYNNVHGLMERVRVLSNGNVGIGTKNADEMLTVNGKIHAREVKINTDIPTPDYVFNKGYALMSLSDVKNYIDKNHHLPEVPSAAEVEKNGLKLAEMNLILLKKVEELTLYLIEKDKHLKAQQQKNDEQEARLLALETIIKSK